MAERRMFAKTIVLSDAFLDMPMSARCLYFTLGMLADDDGFINAPRAIMRQCGASDDDMKLLLAKKFVLLFESGVIVIKHWRINNYLQKDRYTETKYVEEKGTLTLDDKGIYHGPDSMYTQDVYTQDRLGKDRLDKDSIGEVSIGKDREEDSKGKPIHVLTDEQKAERIIHFADMLRAYMGRGWPESGVFKLAALEGITAEELRAATATAAEA